MNEWENYDITLPNEEPEIKQIVEETKSKVRMQEQKPKQEPKQEPKEEKDEWEKYETHKTSGVIKSEYDQKIYILDVDKNISTKNLLSMVTKELDTSFINDEKLKTFYQINFENILEWANMGLDELAIIRLSKLFGELKLEKSLGGFERILQGSSLSGSVIAPLPQKRNLFPVQITKPKTNEPKSLAERLSESE